jgi:glycosyltransferase involved in cell wall biosynthesis
LPTDAECWINIAREARELGEPDLFETALRHARELDPGRAELTELAHESRTLQPRDEVLSRSNERLGRFRNRHRGERCVIIGNGPSLKRMDLSFLRNAITFGLNRVYLLSNDLEFQPSYYVCMNPLVLEQSSREIQAIQAPKFLSAQCMSFFPETEETMFLQPMPGPDFVLEPSRGVWEGYTVTYVALQLAYYMGFSEVVLIGVDHEYKNPPGLPNQEVVSTGDDPNHFHPEYFGKGVRWHLPDLTNAEVAYRLAHERFRADGRSVIDATVEGKLSVFPKRDYHEIFDISPTSPTNVEVQELEPAFVTAEAGPAYKVTAIVSAYGSERFLRDCLEDLERQTIANRIEIIVIDSGSPQDEERIVREFQYSNPNVVYIRTRRETLYEAWNRGIAMARGEYVTNANTDDRHRTDALERLASELDRREVGIVYADSLITTAENEIFERNNADRIWTLPSFSVRQVLMDCPFGPQPMWRRALHSDTGIFEGKYRLAGDYEFFMRLAMRHGAHHLHEVLGLYYEASDNLSYNQEAMKTELAQFLGRFRSTTPIEQIYPFLQEDTSVEARLAAWFDYANHLVWMTPYPALEYAEEIYRKLMARSPTASLQNATFSCGLGRLKSLSSKAHESFTALIC